MEAVEATLRSLKHLKSYEDLHRFLTTAPTEQLRQLGPAIAALISADEVLSNIRRDATAAICPSCLSRLVLVFDALPTLAASTRLDCHPLWDTCVNVVTEKRSDSKVSALKQKLLEAVDHCGVCPRVEPLDETLADRILGPFIESSLQILHNCFVSGQYSLLHRAQTAKGFQFRGASNVWPLSPQQLMPYGAKRTVEALLGWACTWACTPICPAAIQAFMYYLSVLRPQMFPHLLENPQRPLFLWLLAHLLLGDFLRALEHWPGEEPCATTQAGVLHDADTLIQFAGVLLIALTSGPDARADDVSRITRGYEPTLLAAAQSALRRPGVQQSPAMTPVSDFVLVMHRQLRRPDSELPPDLRALARTTLNPLVNPAMYRDTTSALALFFYELRHRRWCAGPGCALAVQDNQDGRPFQRCANCRAVAYCGRACQRADWKQGLEVPESGGATIKHSDVCSILSMVGPMLHTEEMAFAVFAATFRELNLAATEMRVLSGWARASTVLPPDVLAEMALMASK